MRYKISKVLLCFLIISIIGSILKVTESQATITFSKSDSGNVIQKIEISNFNIVNGDSIKNIDVENAVILYNTVMVPMNDVFNRLFDGFNGNQIEYNNMIMTIGEDRITIPNEHLYKNRVKVR